MSDDPIRHVAVFDIGKTNAKVALVDLQARAEIAALRRPNQVRTDGPYPHHDVDELWAFMLAGLETLRRDNPIDALAVTTHGATAALLRDDGELSLPVLDYEFNGPDVTRASYNAIRPPFAETGSPALPLGLNLGAQLFWLAHSFPDAFERTTAILTYPQYWTWRLTGLMASERTSLGCHTDLWCPNTGTFSQLVDTAGWRTKLPPIAETTGVLGLIRSEVANLTGLSPATRVLNGIHDSNASLYPTLAARKPPFSVISTGTWVIAMAIGGQPTPLDAERDTLINVNALGQPVPSSRFMGGREFELLLAGHDKTWTEADIAAVLEKQVMLLPSVVTGSGPFPASDTRWVGDEPANSERFVAVSFYLALMAATCLNLIGAEGDIIVEGPFSENEAFIAMLNAATLRPVVTMRGSGTGTSIGAAMLAGGSVGGKPAETRHSTDSEAMKRYHRAWQRLADGSRKGA